MALTNKELEQWRTVLRILKTENEEQLNNILASYHVEEEEDSRDGE